MLGPILLIGVGGCVFAGGCAAIVAGILGGLSRARRGPGAGDEFAPDDARFGPDSLAPGAVVAHGGVEYVVRGSVHLAEGRCRWHEHLLDGGERGTWLEVEVDEDEGLQLSLWRRRQGTPVSDDAEIELGGRTYRESERGRAGYRCTGTTGLPGRGEMRYVDYVAADDRNRLLGLEKWSPDSAWEASVGERIRPEDCTVYPAPEDHGAGGADGPTTATGVVHGGEPDGDGRGGDGGPR